MKQRTLPEQLKENGSFSKQKYMEVMSSTYHMINTQVSYDLQKRLDEGEVVREGWGIYSAADHKKQYQYSYQKLAEDVIKRLNDNYTDLDFRVFELVQLNEFINHLIGRNAVFVFAENALVDLVFDTLSNAYPGKVLFKPKADDFYRYLQDDQIVVCRLISEAPKGFKNTWEIRLEQIIVDIYADKLLGQIVPEEEKGRVVTGAFDSYVIDRNTMLRYARRRGAEEKIKAFVDNCPKKKTIFS